jgi:hypothetical protein
VYVAAPNAGGTLTTVDAYAPEGCGSSLCDPLASVTARGMPEDMLVAAGHLVVQTSSGAFAYGLPA